MDTIVGYVSFVFDSDTIRLTITQQEESNKFVYNTEENVKLSNLPSNGSASALRSIADHSLVDKLLYKKIRVQVETRDPFGIVGKVHLLETLEGQIS